MIREGAPSTGAAVNRSSSRQGNSTFSNLSSSLNARTPLSSEIHFSRTIVFLLHWFCYTTDYICIIFNIIHLFCFSFFLCYKHPSFSHFFSKNIVFLATTIFLDLPRSPFFFHCLINRNITPVYLLTPFFIF